MCVFIKNTSVASRVSPKTKSRRMRARACACHKRKYSCCAPGMNVRVRVYVCECVYNISKTALPEHRHGPGARAEKPCAEITGEQRWRWRWGGCGAAAGELCEILLTDILVHIRMRSKSCTTPSSLPKSKIDNQQPEQSDAGAMNSYLLIDDDAMRC